MLYAAATVIGFNFGGNFALFPTMTADTFGTKHVGQNYPFIFLAYGIGGIGGPMLGGKLGDLGNFPMAFTICGVLCLAAAGIIAQVNPATESQKMSSGQSGAKPPAAPTGMPPVSPSGGRPIAPA